MFTQRGPGGPGERAASGRIGEQARRSPLAAPRHPAPARPPPAASRCETTAAKFSMCGPKITGFPSSAGSTGFCPPCAVRLLPTKTTVARAYQSRSSPVVSTSSRSKPPLAGSSVRRTIRRPVAASSLQKSGHALHVPRRDDQEQIRHRLAQRREHPREQDSPRRERCSRPRAPAPGRQQPRNSSTRVAPPAGWSNLMLPVQCSFSAGTPSLSQRAMSPGSGTSTCSSRRKIGPVHARNLRKRRSERGERRAFTSVTGMPRARLSASRFGHASPSIRTICAGRTRRERAAHDRPEIDGIVDRHEPGGRVFPRQRITGRGGHGEHQPRRRTRARAAPARASARSSSRPR